MGTYGWSQKKMAADATTCPVTSTIPAMAMRAICRPFGAPSPQVSHIRQRAGVAAAQKPQATPCHATSRQKACPWSAIAR